MKQFVFEENVKKEEYQNFIEKTEIVSFMQNSNWANVKTDWKSFRLGLYQNKKLVAVALLLIKKLTNGIAMGYVPRGYVIDFSNKIILQEFTKGIKQLAKKEHCYMIKIDPNFCFHETSIIEFEKHQSVEVPVMFSKNSQEFHQNLLSLHYKHKGFPKSINKTFQPRYHMMIPLVNKNLESYTHDEIKNSYKKRIRSHLGDYHTNRGVFFEHTTNINQLDEFIAVLNATEKRQGIHLRNKEYFKNIMTNYQEKAVLFFGKLDLKKYLDFLSKNNGKEEEIKKVENLIKEGNHILTLSAALVIMPTNKEGIRVSEYLYAGNILLFNKLEVSLGLVYDICKYSNEHHCTYCNLGGVDGNLNDHLTIYKSKFSSIVMEFAGEYDLPIKKYLYYPIEIFLPILKKLYRIKK
ncbi:MAG: aminoacyltransferase [Bacilli bacterium]|nr:aminoacyltransferase [Bacilli bacterium]